MIRYNIISSWTKSNLRSVVPINWSLSGSNLTLKRKLFGAHLWLFLYLPNATAQKFTHSLKYIFQKQPKWDLRTIVYLNGGMHTSPSPSRLRSSLHQKMRRRATVPWPAAWVTLVCSRIGKRREGRKKKRKNCKLIFFQNPLVKRSCFHFIWVQLKFDHVITKVQSYKT